MQMMNSINTKYFEFKLENESETYIIPSTTVDGSDTIQFSTNWTQLNISGSTEPMVAYNYTNAPTVNINLKFHEDTFQEAGLGYGDGLLQGSPYLAVINKFASLAYPSEKGEIIVPPYVYIYLGFYVYRGFFTNIRINQSGVIRNGYKTTCEINGNFTIIKKYAPRQTDVLGGSSVFVSGYNANKNVKKSLMATGFRVYFGTEGGGQ